MINYKKKGESTATANSPMSDSFFSHHPLPNSDKPDK